MLETIARLEQERDSALAQAAELRRRLEQLACLGNGDRPGNSIGNTIAQEALRITPSQATARLKALEEEHEAVKFGLTLDSNSPTYVSDGVESHERLKRAHAAAEAALNGDSP